jgi:hypothetical protein
MYARKKGCQYLRKCKKISYFALVLSMSGIKVSGKMRPRRYENRWHLP